MDGSTKKRITPGHAVLLAALVVVAAASTIGLIGVLATYPSRAQTASAAPAAVREPALSSVDWQFIEQGRRLGMSVSPGSEQAVVEGGRNVCRRIGSGELALQVMDDLAARRPEMTTRQVGGWVGAAIGAYCPQYGRQIGVR